MYSCILVEGHDSHEDARACLELMRCMESERRYEKNSEAPVTSLVAWLGHNIFTSMKSANVSKFVQSV